MPFSLYCQLFSFPFSTSVIYSVIFEGVRLNEQRERTTCVEWRSLYIGWRKENLGPERKFRGLDICFSGTLLPPQEGVGITPDAQRLHTEWMVFNNDICI